MTQLALTSPSGIAGNLWVAALLGLGADPTVIDGLPEQLGLAGAWIAWRHDRAAGRSEVTLHGAERTPPTDFRGLAARVTEARVSSPVHSGVMRVLPRREEAEARFLGLGCERWTFENEDVADTLLDVVGGVLLWHALNRPTTTSTGPVVVGEHPRGSSLELLDGVPVEVGGADLCLTTPTGAALLRAFWSPGDGVGRTTREVSVPGDFSRAAGLPPLRAALRVGRTPRGIDSARWRHVTRAPTEHRPVNL